LREPFGALPRRLCRLARQLARNGTARVERSKKKRGCAVGAPPEPVDGCLPLLAALFLSTLFRHSSSLKLERSAEKPEPRFHYGWSEPPTLIQDVDY